MMKSLMAVLVAASLAGCATTIANPVSKKDLAAIEAVYGSVLVAAANYSELPFCPDGMNLSLTRLCAERKVVKELGIQGQRANAAIEEARNFVRRYPRLDASAMLAVASSAVTAFRNTAFINGVK